MDSTTFASTDVTSIILFDRIVHRIGEAACAARVSFHICREAWLISPDEYVATSMHGYSNNVTGVNMEPAGYKIPQRCPPPVNHLRRLSLPFVMQGSLIFALGAAFLYLLRRLTHKSLFDELPGPPSSSFITGNLAEFLDRHGWDFHMRLIKDYGPVVKLSGVLNEPLLYVFDTNALQQIFVKDPSAFDQAEETTALFSVMSGPGMVAMPANLHRKQRKIISPAFSLTNLRGMMPMFYSISHKLCNVISAQLETGPREIDMLYWLSRVSLELIGQGGLGESLDSLSLDSHEDEYGRSIKTLFILLLETPLLRQILPFLVRWTPHGFPRWILQFAPSAKVREFARLSQLVIQRASEIYQAKKLAFQQGDEVLAKQVGEGKDILSLLMRANNAASTRDQLPEVEVIGQLTLMVAAATDTTANTLSRLLHRLAMRPDIQEKVRHEILQANCDNACSSEVLFQLPWLDAVLKETMRLNAPGPYIARTTVRDTILPLVKPMRCADGTTISQIPVPKGTKIYIGVYGSNLSKDVWGDDAMEWKPERWFSQTAKSVSSIPSIYANLLTFAAGPRSCIGFKYAELELKILTSVLLSRFSFRLTEKPIHWNLSEVVYPTVGTDSGIASLPLEVSIYKPMAC